jgi:pimeloyl-ACP methyl ester carboxylesterase
MNSEFSVLSTKLGVVSRKLSVKSFLLTAARWQLSFVSVVAVLLTACFRSDPAPYTPHNSQLSAFPLYFYPTVDSTKPAKAFIFFLGNDIGFWGAHQDLAKRLAGSGYDVVGFDVKAYFSKLPDDTLARAAAFRDSVLVMIALARHELHADSMPVIVGGHSIGAEIATWIGRNAPPPGLSGLLLISPGARGHLRVSIADLAMSGEPTEPGSFSVAENISTLAPSLRVALVRGTDDRYRSVDPELMKAGGNRMERWAVPWGGHSMRNIFLAGPFIDRAISSVMPARGDAH